MKPWKHDAAVARRLAEHDARRTAEPEFRPWFVEWASPYTGKLQRRRFPTEHEARAYARGLRVLPGGRRAPRIGTD